MVGCVWCLEFIYFFEDYIVGSELLFYSKEAQTAVNHAGVFDCISRLDPVWHYGGFMQN